MYIIMAIDECGSEVRVSYYDKCSHGFENEADAYEAMAEACCDFEEYRHFWVESSDTAYKLEPFKDAADYVNDDDYEQYFDELEREEMMAEREWAANDD